MNKIIAVDLDEVLAETLHALLKKHKGKIAGVKMSWNDFSSYNLWKIKKLKISKNKAIFIYFWFLLGAGLRNKLGFVGGAKEKLKEFKLKGYKLHVVTARHFFFRFSTGLWLYKNYRHIFYSVEFANFFSRFSTKKSIICKKIGASIIIEDNLENAIDCANAGVKVYLLDKPWNQDYDIKKHKGIIKVKSWMDINL